LNCFTAAKGKRQEEMDSEEKAEEDKKQWNLEMSDIL
jgi:hypothetical protein